MTDPSLDHFKEQLAKFTNWLESQPCDTFTFGEINDMIDRIEKTEQLESEIASLRQQLSERDARIKELENLVMSGIRSLIESEKLLLTDKNIIRADRAQIKQIQESESTFEEYPTMYSIAPSPENPE